MKLTRETGLDPAADLAAITEFAVAWRSMFRKSKVTYTQGHFLRLLEELSQAVTLRLYLVTNPAQPVALALLHPITPEEGLLLMSLASGGGDDLVKPFGQTPAQMRQALGPDPAPPTGRGVYPFLLGEPGGITWLDLPPEGLVLAMARFGERNLVDPEPFLAQRLRRLGERIQKEEEPA